MDYRNGDRNGRWTCIGERYYRKVVFDMNKEELNFIKKLKKEALK